MHKVQEVLEFWGRPNQDRHTLPRSVYTSPEELTLLTETPWGIMVHDSSIDPAWATLMVHTQAVNQYGAFPLNVISDMFDRTRNWTILQSDHYAPVTLPDNQLASFLQGLRNLCKEMAKLTLEIMTTVQSPSSLEVEEVVTTCNVK